MPPLPCFLGGEQGRTFPVEQLYLEDCYQATGYVLDADSPAALPHQSAG